MCIFDGAVLDMDATYRGRVHIDNGGIGNIAGQRMPVKIQDDITQKHIGKCKRTGNGGVVEQCNGCGDLRTPDPVDKVCPVVKALFAIVIFYS